MRDGVCVLERGRRRDVVWKRVCEIHYIGGNWFNVTVTSVPAGESKNSQEWFITRETQDIRVVSVFSLSLSGVPAQRCVL